MQVSRKRIVVLGTGGTIAGRAASAQDNVGYRAGEVGVADLKPSSAAISARVGGAPVCAMALWIRSRICCWRGVSFGVSIIAGSSWRGAAALRVGLLC